MKKLLVLVAGGIGYVLGTKAGRERYDQIRGTFNKVKDDPRVQEKAHQAADLAKEKAPVVKDAVTSAAGSATDKVKSATSSSPDPSIGDDKLNPESLHFQDRTGPQGDLP
jgi:hypothetical protein